VNIRDFHWFFHLRQAIWPWNHRNFWLTNLSQTNVASLLESLQVLHVSTILCKPCNFDHLLIKNKERKSNQYQHSFPNSNLKPQKYSSPWMRNEQIILFDDHKQLCSTILGKIRKKETTKQEKKSTKSGQAHSRCAKNSTTTGRSYKTSKRRKQKRIKISQTRYA